VPLQAACAALCSSTCIPPRRRAGTGGWNPAHSQRCLRRGRLRGTKTSRTLASHTASRPPAGRVTTSRTLGRTDTTRNKAVSAPFTVSCHHLRQAVPLTLLRTGYRCARRHATLPVPLFDAVAAWADLTGTP